MLPVQERSAALEREKLQPKLAFDSVSLTYPDGTEALKDVSLEVRPGEFVSVVGPSGCGKSTLLRIASGLIGTTSGKVTVDRSAMGYVFQDATLLPWRTVLGNAALLLELHGAGKAEREKKAKEALELVGLRGFESHYPRRLSGGMKMRVSLARALTLEPSLFLFDEPFGALDEITRERLNDELLSLFVDRGFASVFVTHSIYEAVYLSSRIVVMSARPGRIAGVFDVPMDYPRGPEFRYSAEFAQLAGDVYRTLRETNR
jgi:NitT/TauT family transport system ATP-binding protein